MSKAYGKKMSLKLQQRLMELMAAESLADMSHLPPTRCHQLDNTGSVFSVNLEHPYRLLFVPAEEPMPCKKDGGIDLHKVAGIEIIAIEDTHDPKNQRRGRL